jgi:hypothetical protein
MPKVARYEGSSLLWHDTVYFGQGQAKGQDSRANSQGAKL